jgi:hypothetical protein
MGKGVDPRIAAWRTTDDGRPAGARHGSISQPQAPAPMPRRESQHDPDAEQAVAWLAISGTLAIARPW